MKLKVNILDFEISGISFHYIYSNYITISEKSTIHNFLLKQRLSHYDVINRIFVREDLSLECNQNEVPIFKTPAWSLFSNYVVFHPNGELIAKMNLIDGFDEVETIIKDLNFTMHPLPICITGLLLQKKLMQKRSGLIMHGATIKMENTVFVLTGNSGVGKSTLSTLIANNTSCERISDDRFILRYIDGTFYSYGNPFDIKVERNLNKGVPVDRLFFLHHDTYNHHKKIKSNSLINRLFTISILPYWDRTALIWSVEYLRDITKKIACYDLFFKPDADIIKYMAAESFFEKRGGLSVTL